VPQNLKLLSITEPESEISYAYKKHVCKMQPKNTVAFKFSLLLVYMLAILNISHT